MKQFINHIRAKLNHRIKIWRIRNFPLLSFRPKWRNLLSLLSLRGTKQSPLHMGTGIRQRSFDKLRMTRGSGCHSESARHSENYARHSEATKNPSRMRVLKHPLALTLSTLKKPLIIALKTLFGPKPFTTLKKPIALTLIITLILGVVIIAPWKGTQTAQAAWYNSSWLYRQKIIIDHNKVPNTDQSDFPVLIKITDANNAIFTKAKDDGADIRFTQTNQTSDLSFEVETFSKTSHELWAWVKIPTLSHATDTTIYLYYGNSSATDPGAASHQATWSNEYAGVWHMDDAGPTNVADSTSNIRTGTATNNPSFGVSGKIGSRMGFSTNQYIETNYVLPTTSFSFGGWANSSSTGWSNRLMGNADSSAGATGADIIWQQSGSNTLYAVVRSGGGGPDISATVTGLSSGWHYLVLTLDPTNKAILYCDGNPVGNSSRGSIGSTLTFRIGRDGNSADAFNGFIDETRISNTARSADWISTEYANQNAPETFATISGEVGKDNYTYQASPVGWYNMAWANRQPIVFDHSKVPNTNQTDFPALVKITDQNNELFTKAQSSGNDIVFADSSGNKLAHEIEQYSTSSGSKALWAWVKIPTLLSATNTTIYMYYGNANSPNQQSKTAVWSNGYVGVWHMGEASGNVLDSTGSANNATGHGNTQVASVIDKGQHFAINQYAKTTQNVSLTTWTISAFADMQHASGNWPVDILTNDVGTYRMMLSPYPTEMYARMITPGGNIIASNVQVGVHHIVSTREASGAGVVYVDGGVGNTGTLGTISFTGGWSISGGAYLAYARETTFDQITVSNVARSADWIATEYANQNDPAGFESFSAAETADTFAPNNPSTITALYSPSGTPVANNAGSDSTPYYSWPEPEAAGGATDATGAYISGVAGYYSYFGTSCGGGGADPAASRGVLADTGSGLHYSSDVNVSVPDLTTNQGAYCLRIKTKDNAGNVSATTYQAATYNFDTTAPNAPTFIAANPAGYSSVNSFDFTWPASVDAVGSGASGVGGYQYKRGNGTDDWSATQVATSKTAITSYQTGSNIFIVRSIDNAGNTSNEVQTTYYYSLNPPAKPTALASVPDMFSDTNSFSFSWTAPVHDRPIVDYGYSINAAPTTSNLTWTGSATTTLAADAYATLQGNNTIYLIAKDDSGAYALSDANVASLVFNCQTTAPPIPLNPTISDSSNRAYSTYSLTVKWNAGTGQDSGTFDHYLIERSTNGTDYSELATTTSTAYIDVSDLSNSTTYYYRVKAVDNADSVSASSTIVSRIPTGKYTTAPLIIQGPTATSKASTATITWVTNRSSTAGVRFGTSENELTRSQIDSTEATEHSITIPGLEGGTRYYYQVQSLDNDRDYSSETAYSVTGNFDTLALPVIADVKISNITLNSADLSWTSSTASNTHLSYGTTINYGTGYEELDSFTTNHTYKLTGLADSSTYHFKITGVDQDGNTLISDDYVFDTLPRPKISAVNFETDLTSTQPKSYITWTTNVATTSSVDYSPKGGSATYEESQSSYITAHKVELSKLSDNTSYSFTVYGSDQFGNKTISDEYSFATPFDSRPAIITDVSVEASNVGLDKTDKAQLIVSWHTDEVATTQVEYGQGVSGDYTNKTAEDKTLTNEHFVIISDLIPNTPYHLRAVSRDKGGNLSMSEDVNSIPGEVPKSMLQTLLATFNNVFGWLGKLM